MSNWNFYGPFIHDIRNDDDDDDDAFRSPNAYYQGGTRETRSYKMLMDILVLKMVFEGWDQIEEKVHYTLNIYEFERKKLEPWYWFWISCRSTEVFVGDGHYTFYILPLQ